ncbi:hypothetical protein ACRJ4B_34860 [Streptomyces sp. GTA36]
MPKSTEPDSATTRLVAARARSTRPAPCWWTFSSGLGSAEPVSSALSRAPLQSGCCWSTRAAAPATCGAAIDVPEFET